MKKIFNIIFLIIIFLTPINLKSQTAFEEVVYLKNGSVIHGLIIEQIPNQSIKIQTRDGNIFVYKIDEIKKLTKEQNNYKKERITADNSDIKISGYSNITELNLGVSLKEYNIGIQTINGYLINPNLNIGVGIGIQSIIGSDYCYIPIFADIRTYFLKNKSTPFFSTGLGYSFSTDKATGSGINKGGFFINPSFGGKFLISDKTSINISLGYLYQQTYYKYPIPEYSHYNYLSIFNLKFGFTF